MKKIRTNAYGTDIAYEHGYVGAFTRSNAAGAIEAGARVRKVWMEDGDSHALDATGIVLGSIKASIGIGYFVEWDDMPKTAVFVTEKKLAREH